MFTPLALLAYLLFRKEERLFKSINSRTVDLPEADGFYTFNVFFVIRKGKKINVLLNKCTHLGCRLLEKDDNELICPCHGSKFSKNGKVLNGPASRNLIKAEFTVDYRNKKIKIYEIL